MTHIFSKISLLHILFVISLLLAGSGWICIRVQLEYVPADLAVFYRFFISGLGLLAFSYLKGEKFQKLPLHFFPWLISLGITFYYANTWSSYQAVAYLPSGLVAMGVSMLMVPSSLLDSFWNKKPIQKHLLFSGALSLIGLFFALDNDKSFGALEVSTGEIIGFGYILLCLGFASVGGLLAVHLRKLPVTLIQGTGYGLLSGAFFNFIIHLFSGQPFLWYWDSEFLLTLLYLSIFVSGFVFVCYNRFIQAWGVGTANYFFVLMPIIAMVISGVFEDMAWTLPRILGMILVLFAGVVALRPDIFKKIFALLKSKSS